MMGQSGLWGDTFTFSADNLPDTFGITTDPVSGEVTDHGTPPVVLTFDGIAEPAGGLNVNERVTTWDGQEGGITAYHYFLDVEQDLVDWTNPGEIVEFSMQTRNGDYISNNDFEHSFYALRGLDWANSEPGSQPEFYETGFYFYFTRDGVPATGYATQIDTGLAVGPHPFDASVPEVVYIGYSQGQVNEITDPYPGGTDLLGGTTQLDEQSGSWAALAEVMGLEPTQEINGQPANGYHVGFLVKPPEGAIAAGILRAGDADQDLDFDQLDLILVQQGAKYLTGQTATWGEGDWNGAPGGVPGSPPSGDGRFDQLDIIAALAGGVYLTGPYAAIGPSGTANDAQTSIIYHAGTGELAVDAPAGVQLTSINIESAASIFTGDPAQGLGGSFDNDTDNNIFKATFGSSFGSMSFGNVAQAGLSQDVVAGDLTVVGSLAGGGSLGNVDLIYVPVPEPSSLLLLALGILVALRGIRQHCAA